MRKTILLAGLLAAVGCKKPPPATRPLDVCAGTAAAFDCAAPPDGEARDANFSPAESCYVVGNQQFHCGLFEAASKSLEKSALIAPSARTYHALGEAYFLQEKWVEARAAYRKAVDLDGKKRESWVRIGQLDNRAHSFADAHEALGRATALDPKRPDAMRADAEALTGLKKFDDAVALLRKAEALGTPQDHAEATEQEVEVRRLQVLGLQKAHAPDEALQAPSQGLADALDRMIALAPTDPRLQRDLADARLAAGDLDGARAALEKASALDPKDFVSPRLVGLMLEKQGDAAGARKALQASLQIHDKQAMPYIILGRMDAAAGDAENAKHDFDLALANEDAKDAVETRSLAELAFTVGRKDKAEQLYALLDDDPQLSTSVDFWLDRARVSAALAHRPDVEKACAKAKALSSTVVCPPRSKVENK